MTTDQWTQLADVVPDALALPPAERDSFLDRTCRTPDGAPDDALRREAETLLAAAAAADTSGRLDSPVGGLASGVARDEQIPARALPARIGAWRIDGVLGEGGMGTVYRARRTDGAFERTVALKVLRGGAASPDLTRRFEAERQMLARLEHPGIARLYDGGVDAEGRPYLAMELVDGVPITTWAQGADGKAPSVAARLEAFLQAADAVAYAHRHLIVHRDLKPSNLLVTAGGTVKLLDFGIAKLLDADDALLTRDGMGPLTLAYAAPEQIRGETVTTATDVYGLGVLLYEILTGQRPTDLARASPAEVERRLATEPSRPSAVVAAPDLAQRLRGDLDTIVLKAMAPEPARRYASADALAADLRRHRDGLPVTARPSTTGYRVASFVRRHRAGAIAAAVATLALVGGTGASLWQAHRAADARDQAEARFAIARDAARALIYEVHDAVAPLDGSTEAQALLLGRSIDYLDRLAADAGADRALRVDLAEAYFRIGQVQGGPNAPSLGRSVDAAASFRRGLDVLPPSSRPTAGDSLGRRAETVRGRLMEKLGGVLATRGRLPEGLRLLDDALDAFDRALGAAPDDPDLLALRAGGLINRGDYTGHPDFPSDGRPADAYNDYFAAREIVEDLPEARRSLYAERLLAITWEREGTLLVAAGDLDAALASYRRALALRQALAADPGADYDTRRDAGVAAEKMGLALQALGRPADALTYQRRALGIYADLARANPANAGAQRTLAIGHLHVARVLGGTEGAHLGRRAEARAEIDRALALLRPLAARDSGDVGLRDLLRSAEVHRRALR